VTVKQRRGSQLTQRFLIFFFKSDDGNALTMTHQAEQRLPMSTATT